MSYLKEEKIVRRNNLFLGIFFVFLGVFFLLSNFNIINFSISAAIFDLWPLFFVMLGIHLISRKKLVKTISWIVFFAIIILYAINYGGGNIDLNLFNIKNYI